MTGKREGEAFARTVKRKDGLFVVLVSGLAGGELSGYFHDEWEADQNVNRLNKAADAHALKVGLRMLEMAAKAVCSGCKDGYFTEKPTQETPGGPWKHGQEYCWSGRIHALIARIEKGEVVV